MFQSLTSSRAEVLVRICPLRDRERDWMANGLPYSWNKSDLSRRCEMQTNETDNQMTFFDQDLWFSRMSKNCFPQMTEKTSEESSKRRQRLPTVVPQFLDCRPDRLGLTQEPLWETDGLSLGGYMTDSFGESPSSRLMARWSREAHPNAVEDSVLSQILEDNPHPKYSLSPKACQGILNRAGKRGKELPKILHDALMEQVTHSRFGGALKPTPTDGEQEKAH